VFVTESACATLGGVYRGDLASCSTANCPLPPGACCFPNGTCASLTQAQCLAQGGLFQGVGVTCATASCPLPKGACCLDSGACAFLTEEECLALGATYQGDLVPCADVSCPQPPGACCFENGTCAFVTQATCLALGGIPQGDFVTCADADCPPPSGACCFPDGSCLPRTQADCLAQGGLFQGAGVTCVVADCPQPKGACCLPSGSCAFVTEATCAALGGTYQADFVQCADVSCPQPPGACCFPDGSCLPRTQADCLAEGGLYQGNFTECADVECPQPPGACCFPNGSCLVRTQEDCLAEGGLYQGDFVTCADADCPQPKGACCLPIGSCTFVTQEVCATLGGTYQGDFVVCPAVVCPKPPGACCLDDGSCVHVTQDECAALGGSFQGNFTQCADVICEQPPGACCLADGSCVEVTQAECLAMGGVFQGNFTHCVDIECPHPPGACCLDDGTCIEVMEEECGAMGGEFQGDFTHCVDVECPHEGACCLPPPPPPPPPGDFLCTNKIVFEKMIWDGTVPIRVKAYDGLVGAPVVADIDNVQVGDEVNIGPFAGPNDHIWEIYHAGTSTLIGLSKFHRSCSDDDMDGPEDCGKRQGNGKANEAGLINDWILEGLTDGAGASFDCGASGGGGTDEVCTVVSPEECEALGGAYQGNGTDCDSVECVGACCLPPPPASDFVCTNKVEFMTMIWDGAVPVRIKVYDGLVGGPLLADIDNIQVGDDVTTGPYAGPNDFEWQIFDAGTSTLIGKSKFHRSCSDDDMDGPEDCGKRQGNGKANEAGLINDWILEGLVDGSGASFDCGLSGGDDECTVVTGVECAALGGTFQGVGTECADVECAFYSPCCDGGERIRVLAMMYTADDCSATHHDQESGKVICSDFGPLPDTVFILSTDKDNPADGGAKIWFAGTVSVGEVFDIDAMNAGQVRLTTDTRIHVFDHEGGTRLQFVKLHTSCSQPIAAGDQYGCALLVGCVGENDAAAHFIEVPIVSDLDDAEETLADGTMHLDGVDLDLAGSAAPGELVGLRFTGLLIPQKATIESAWVQFHASQIDAVDCVLTIEGEAADHAESFAAVAHDICTRPRTAASLAWTPPAWTAVGQAGPGQRTPDLTAIVKEIVNRPGWSYGNAMVFVIGGAGSRTAAAFAGGPESAAVLRVAWSLPTDPNGDGHVDGRDLMALLAAWGHCTSCPEDLNGDGFVDHADLQAIFEGF
jgi:hypothetical protein